MKFAERMSRLGTETAFEVLAQVNALKAEGRDIVSFSIGEPDFATPENIREAGKKAIDDEYTHYTPSAGMMEFREVIAEEINRTRGTDYTAANVVVTPDRFAAHRRALVTSRALIVSGRLERREGVINVRGESFESLGKEEDPVPRSRDFH